MCRKARPVLVNALVVALHFLLQVFWGFSPSCWEGSLDSHQKLRVSLFPLHLRSRNRCRIFKTLHREFGITIYHILYRCYLLNKSCKGLGTIHGNCYYNWPLFWCFCKSEIWIILWEIKYLLKDTQHLPFPPHCSSVFSFLPRDPSPTSLHTDIIYLLLLLTLLQMPPIFPPPQAAAPAPAFTASLSVSMDFAYMHVCSLTNLFQSPTPSPLRSISLFHVPKPLVLFCLSVYFVH